MRVIFQDLLFSRTGVTLFATNEGDHRFVFYNRGSFMCFWNVSMSECYFEFLDNLTYFKKVELKIKMLRLKST